MSQPMTIPDMHKGLTQEQAALLTATMCGMFDSALLRSGATPEQAEQIVMACLVNAHAEAIRPGAYDEWIAEGGPDQVFRTLEMQRVVQ